MKPPQPMRGDPDEIATDWLLARDQGLSVDQEKEFQIWLSESDANREAWSNASQMWSAFDDERDPLLASMYEAARRFYRPRARIRVPHIAFAATAAAAAVVAVITVPMSGLIHSFRTSGPQPQQIASTQFEGTDSPSIVRLPDGSRITLDVHARLTVRETAARRDIDLLDGRAYFEVAHDFTRPFVVSSVGHSVTATGTAFSVVSRPLEYSVVLASGRVLIAAEGRAPTALEPGNQYRVGADAVARVTPVDVSRALAWRNGYLNLRNVPISEALARMNRGSSHTVEAGDGVVGSLMISGRFRAGDPLRFARELEEIYPVKLATRADGQAVLVSRSHPHP